MNACGLSDDMSKAKAIRNAHTEQMVASDETLNDPWDDIARQELEELERPGFQKRRSTVRIDLPRFDGRKLNGSLTRGDDPSEIDEELVEGFSGCKTCTELLLPVKNLPLRRPPVFCYQMHVLCHLDGSAVRIQVPMARADRRVYCRHLSSRWQAAPAHRESQTGPNRDDGPCLGVSYHARGGRGRKCLDRLFWCRNIPSNRIYFGRVYRNGKEVARYVFK